MLFICEVKNAFYLLEKKIFCMLFILLYAHLKPHLATEYCIM